VQKNWRNYTAYRTLNEVRDKAATRKAAILRTQKNVRASLPRPVFIRMKKIAEIQRMASFKAEALFSMTASRQDLTGAVHSCLKIQANIRKLLVKAPYQRDLKDIITTQKFARLRLPMKERMMKVHSAEIVQHFYRFWTMRTIYRKRKVAAVIIERMMSSHLARKRKKRI